MKGAVLLIGTLVTVIITSIGMSPAGSLAAERAEKADLLFVQTARYVKIDGQKLILEEVSPTTLFFTDRPERIAGNMSNDMYLKLWTEEGKNSFLADPPNATLSVFSDDKVGEMVVTLRNPQYNGQAFSYDIDIIKGELPEKGGPCALYVDIIGMPLTPISYAGAARRRVYRRW